MKNRSLLVCLGLASLLSSSLALSAQETLERAYKELQVVEGKSRDAFLAHRRSGKYVKGQVLPPEIQSLRDAAEAARKEFLSRFGQKEGLTSEELRIVAKVYQSDRDYVGATAAYRRSLENADLGEQENRVVLKTACIAALNSKDAHVAETMMRRMIEAEKNLPPRERVGERVRMLYYPRVLIQLSRFEELKALAEGMQAEKESPEARDASLKFRFIAAVNLGDVETARKIASLILKGPEVYPGLQGWAVQAQMALLVNVGQHDAAVEVVKEYLERSSAGNKVAAPEKNARQRLLVISGFLGKPAPALAVDHWVGVEGEEELGRDPLPDPRGRVIMLDFFQSWCEPCRKAMPHLVAMQEQHGDLLVLGLCRVENWFYDPGEKRVIRPVEAVDYPKLVTKFRQDMELNYPVGVADGMANNVAYKIRGVPTLVLIDRKGIVRYMSIGAGERGLLELAVAGVVRGR